MSGPVSQSYDGPNDDPVVIPAWAYDPDHPDNELVEDFGGDDGYECCRHCGKEFEDFSDMGCEYCDRRHPGYGTLD